MLKEVKTLNDYPSASGIEYLNSKFYIIGDDAKDLLILDSSLTAIDSIPLYSSEEKRIPKKTKADIESITFTSDKKLLLLGSGSAEPYRNFGWLIDPVSKQKDNIKLDIFYQRLKESGLPVINIEGVCSVPGATILSNRGNKTFPKNHLVITSDKFWKQQATSSITLVLIGGNTDTSLFNGVSGLAYSTKTDRLILTVSTEDTKNSIDDGTIGKSYLWVVDNFSTKKNWKAMNPDQVLDLGAMDPKLKGQKIESVCIEKETKDFFHLVLVADNDDGSSNVFRLLVEKK